MKEELEALETPLRKGFVLRLMCNSSTNKRSACLEDPTKPEMEQEHSYHDSICLNLALKGVAELYNSGGGLTQAKANIGSASSIDPCDSWLLEGNTIWARYRRDRFVVIAREGVNRGHKKGEGETLASAYEALKSCL